MSESGRDNLRGSSCGIESVLKCYIDSVLITVETY